MNSFELLELSNLFFMLCSKSVLLAQMNSFEPAKIEYHVIRIYQYHLYNLMSTLKLSNCTVVCAPSDGHVKITVIRDSDRKTYTATIPNQVDGVRIDLLEEPPFAQFGDGRVYLTWLVSDWARGDGSMDLLRLDKPRPLVVRVDSEHREIQPARAEPFHEIQLASSEPQCAKKYTVPLLNSHKWSFGSEIFAKCSPYLDSLIFRCLGTKYGAHTHLDRFFLEVNEVPKSSGWFSKKPNPTGDFIRKYGLTHLGSAEIEFNLNYQGVSILDVSLERACILDTTAAIAFHTGGRILGRFNFAITRTASTSYIYIFKSEHDPPEEYEAVFNIRQIITKKYSELKRFFPEARMPKFMIHSGTQMFSLCIYKVRSDIFPAERVRSDIFPAEDASRL